MTGGAGAAMMPDEGLDLDAMVMPDVGVADAALMPDAASLAPDAQICFSQTFDSTPLLRPVDIIWVIDASPSMGEEIAIIEAELNDFAGRIAASGLDYRVVVVGSDREQYIPAEARQFFEICVPPPLSGAAQCPDVDSPRYRHVREPIHSREALAEAVATFEQYRDFLRPEANKHFVFVTDDDEGWGDGAEDFAALIAREAALGDRAIVHSIVDLVGQTPGCAFDDSCSCGESRGEAYLALSEATGGLQQSICLPDWSPIFEALEARVVQAQAVPCTFDVPDPGERFEVEYTDVQVRTAGPNPRDLPAVDGPEDCTDEGGWYFDAPADPQRLLLCPASCGAEAEALEIELACIYEKT